MCGLCGYTKSGTQSTRSVIEKMKNAMIHRGPDDHGTFKDQKVVMGHRRLSVIDLETGHQPMMNEDRSIIVVSNGEIYNYRSLKTELDKKGHRFLTNSDTEVLAHLWEEYKEEMMTHLIGMFAFALWDSKKRILFLARDRYGQKPLYYAERSGQLIFASSLKAMLAHPDIDPIISNSAFSQYLAYDYIPAPMSIYRGVYKLDAGSTLKWNNGNTEITRYWDFPLDRGAFKGCLNECAEELERLLDQSVKRRLISDVPLGVFLSGGIDSSAIVGLTARHIPSHKIKTFSIGFHEKTFDESAYAQSIARHFGTDHREEILDEQRLVHILPKVIRAYDEPFADASAIPTYMLAQFTRQHVTVALGGDGGDELFAGYDAFMAHRFARGLEIIPRSIINTVFLKSVEKMPVSDVNVNIPFLAKRFLKSLNEEPVLRNFLWLGSFDQTAQKKLLTPAFSEGLGNPFQKLISDQNRNPQVHYLDAVAYAYIHNYLQEGILTKVDRASMYHSLEVRAPFLDHELGEFTASIPVSWKVKGLTKKYILKKALRNLLPKQVLKRSKRGFGIPKARWLRGALRPPLEKVFSEKALHLSGVFSYPFIRKMMNDHFSRKEDYQKELWTLFMFELWRKEHGGVFLS